MNGKLFIDGLDVYEIFGLFVQSNSYVNLLPFAHLKSIDFNDWWEEDGIEPDLSNPTLDIREFNMSFATHKKTLTDDFITLISDKAYHEFEFKEIGKTYKLRMLEQSGLFLIDGLETFSLKFADDFPFPENYVYVAPIANIVHRTGYELDGIDLANYGIAVLQGTKAEILKMPVVKKNLLSNYNGMHGVTYDGEFVKFQQKDVQIHCLIKANTIPEFWRNYNALLYNLTRPNERILYYEGTGLEYPCFYKACKGIETLIDGRMWYKFSITLVFISFRTEKGEYLLAMEDGDFVCTEDGEYLIDINTL